MLRHRHALAIAALLCTLAPAAIARAADKAPYAVTASATRTAAGQIQVSVTLSRTAKQDVPGIGPTDVTTTQASPKVTLLDGQHAQIAIGNPTRANATPDTLDSGYKFDLISIKGQDRLLLVTTAIDNALVTWADATTLPITPASK